MTKKFKFIVFMVLLESTFSIAMDVEEDNSPLCSRQRPFTRKDPFNSRVSTGIYCSFGPFSISSIIEEGQASLLQEWDKADITYTLSYLPSLSIFF